MSSILQKDIKVKGDLKSKSDIFFDGNIDGNIDTKSNLTIGNNSVVKGNLKSEKVLIEGNVSGEGDFKSCQLTSTAKLRGVLKSNKLTMEEGSCLDGTLKIGNLKADSSS